MRNESAARRWLPIFATAVLLGITCWQLVDSSLPPRIWLVEAEVVVVASVMLEITIRLRRAARVNASSSLLCTDSPVSGCARSSSASPHHG